MIWFTTKDGKYRIESLSPATFPGALRVIKEAFFQDEYVCIGCEVNKNPQAGEELLELCADSALDGVSLVAVASNTEEVVSVAINKIQVKVESTSTTDKPFFEIFAEERCQQDSSRSLVQFMASVDERCNLFETYGVDCSIEIMFIATLREHRNNRLASYLCEFSIEAGRRYKNDRAINPMAVSDLGPEYSAIQPRKPIKTYPKICQAIWTSPMSQKVGKNVGFNVHLTVPFSEFVYKGKSYSDRIGDEFAFCEVVALLL